MTHIGVCTKCRKAGVVRPCRIESFPGDRRAVDTKLCGPCIVSFKVVTVTMLSTDEQSAELTQVYS